MKHHIKRIGWGMLLLAADAVLLWGISYIPHAQLVIGVVFLLTVIVGLAWLMGGACVS